MTSTWQTQIVANTGKEHIASLGESRAHINAVYELVVKTLNGMTPHVPTNEAVVASVISEFENVRLELDRKLLNLTVYMSRLMAKYKDTEHGNESRVGEAFKIIGGQRHRLECEQLIAYLKQLDKINEVKAPAVGDGSGVAFAPSGPPAEKKPSLHLYVLERRMWDAFLSSLITMTDTIDFNSKFFGSHSVFRSLDDGDPIFHSMSECRRRAAYM